ncbi:hypothetical protein GGI55_002883 [Rhizobium leguminosarum]|uniref:hypothetical protein n=1 Tax=Rhizobium TaxID=379 RepID=UPI001611FDA8|nr:MULTISPECIES: hypothetical protein [Rhizobium]MBB4295085.1 hypothetical protein [Rhizobium leguminosarum]MBB4417941.1 hypothetical protein [Rhizobium leguminosarum]MBB4432786.1 hypothetical protein [Rhizobium esperanzae]MBB4542289.1 hypothetical protein [Rhizobium leguminosarum]MBB5650043.1 hypothetical protein [Rhizobium leguminosarum]
MAGIARVISQMPVWIHNRPRREEDVTIHCRKHCRAFRANSARTRKTPPKRGF